MSAQLIAAENKPDDFEIWLGERNQWLQTTANRLIEKKAMPTPQDITELSDLCLGEATGTGIYAFEKVIPGSMVQAAVRPVLHLRGLAEVRGVNKIKDLASLNFGKNNLTVVYGANGSGKTGFSRVLKQICGSRMKEDIHPNVFDKVNPACEAKIAITTDGVESDLSWSLKEGPLSLLRNVHVFDSKTASNYVASQNEARYEPSRMRFVTALIKASDDVAAQLSARKVLLVKKLPQFPVTFSETASAKWLLSIKATLSIPEVEKACEYSQQLDEERLSVERDLAQKDIAGRLVAIGKEQAALTQIYMTLNLLKNGLSDEKLGALLAAREDSALKRKIASEAATKVFAHAPIGGVGQETWMALWEQARVFSQLHAYPEKKFPNVEEGAHCVFCQQILTEDGKFRLAEFENFVAGGLEDAAKKGEKLYGELVKNLPILPQAEGWLLQAGVLKLDDVNADAFFKALNARKSMIANATKVEDLPVINWDLVEDANLTISNALLLETKTLKDLQADGKRKQLEAKVAELLAKQWLNQNQVSIVNEVERLKAIALLDKAIAITNTSALTRKHSELSRDDLYKGYQDRFAAELEFLGGKKFPVKPESKQAGKGRITFGLTLQGVERNLPAEAVLSEGETRIVALAAFLADISGQDHGSPFIFDDPISSLDQDFEEKVVERLIQLSKTRQVIIFTHRLSLMAILESEVKKLKDKADLAHVDADVSLHIQSVCSFGKNSGIVHEVNIRDVKPKAAINRMKEQVRQLRKLYDAVDVKGYDERANGICSDLRILVERCVECVLLNEVLVRFRRSLQTQGRIGQLAKITVDDCGMIDDLMTRYSVFEHSQSDELPATRPEIEDIESDINKLAEWMDEFSNRKVA